MEKKHEYVARASKYGTNKEWNIHSPIPSLNAKEDYRGSPEESFGEFSKHRNSASNLDTSVILGNKPGGHRFRSNSSESQRRIKERRHKLDSRKSLLQLG